MQDDFRHLETLCQARDRAALLAGIQVLLKKRRDSTSLTRALDWLWRVGMTTEGLRFALRKDLLELSSTRHLKQKERVFWIARYLMALGAAPFAKRLLDSVTPDTQRQKLMAGLMYVNLGRNREAVQALKDVASKAATEGRWDVFTGLASAHANLGEHEAALALLSAARRFERGEVDAWTLDMYEARSWISKPDPGFALDVFAAADARLPRAPELAPRIYAWSRHWKGVALAQAGRTGDAIAAFTESERIFRFGLPDYQPWWVVGVWDRMHGLNVLEGAKLKEFRAYPIKPYFASFRGVVSQDDPAARLRLAIHADECWINQRPELGLSLELRMVAYLALAGSLGVHRNTLKCLLWPDEISLFFQLDERLAQLASRIRYRRGIKIRFERSVYFLNPKELGHIAVDTTRARPSFLDGVRGEFTSREVSSYYELSSRGAQIHIDSWRNREWVARQGAGRRVRYRASK